MLRRDDSGEGHDEDGMRNGTGYGGYGQGKQEGDGSHGSMMRKKRHTRRKRKGDHKCIIM